MILVLIIAQSAAEAQNVANGEKLFKATCTACHTIGGGKIVGPDLKSVGERRKESWLISFIKSSQTMVKNGDAAAVKLFNDYNKIPMPDQALSDAQVKDILAYIASKSPAPKTTSTTTTNTKTDPKTDPKTTVKTDPKTTTPEVKKDTVKTPPPAPEWVESDIKIKSVKATAEINPMDLAAAFWQTAPATKMPISAQNIVYPNLKEASVLEVSVRSAYRDKQLAFFLEWDDKSKDFEVDVNQFCDQFAVQLPVDVNNIPSYMMGNQGGMVHITHWKAIWQEDCEHGFRDVQNKYPNMWVDVYPGLEDYLDRSKRIYAQDISAEHIVETHSTDHMPGTYSGNPISQIKRKTPVEEASAEGFGTLATQQTQGATGWAQWNNGKWQLCVVVPVNTGNIYKASFKDKTKVAFAIWDGNKENIGGRKHFSQWADLLIEK